MLPTWRREARARKDVQALAAWVEEHSPILPGNAPSHADVAAASITAHMLEAPFASAAADEVARDPALRAHLQRLRTRMSASPPE